MRIAIAGASGFIGRALIQRLLSNPEIKIKALSRSGSSVELSRVENEKCDLFSMLDIEKALKGQDEAVYLVHSMLPSSQLSQGSFADYDLILADNFARAAKKAGLRRVCYLGGIIPHDTSSLEELSLHLRSRLEVEEIFKSYSLPTLIFRAGMIMGLDGSSFQMLLRLVERLPLMLCPAWTLNKTSPIHVRDVCESIAEGLSQDQLLGSFDLAGPESLSYLEMMKVCAERLQKRRAFLDVPFFSPKLSKLWVRLVTGAPKNLVYPLIDSLQHDMSPGGNRIFSLPQWKYTSFRQALEEYVVAEERSALSTPKAYKKANEHKGTVQSVQRHRLPEGKTALWASHRYVEWLNENFRGLINVRTVGDLSSFYLLGSQNSLLELKLSRDRSSEDRVLFYITGGQLAAETRRGRLEFRSTPDKKFLITAIHDFKPRLPWYLYKYSQAILHASVMSRFGKSLCPTDQ